MCSYKSRGNWNIGNNLSQEQWDKIFRKGDFVICNNCVKKTCKDCPLMKENDAEV